MNYVLITPARNEAAFMQGTIESVIAQTKLPMRWVIVDDGSTDKTAEIVESYANRHSWMRLVRRPVRADRTFSGKVHSFNAGLEQVTDLTFDVLGNLDADVTFGRDHLAFLVNKFAEDPRLGVGGTAYTEDGWDSIADSFEGETSVHGAMQFFRYSCFQDIGGYVPHSAGGIDWTAVTSARMKGWRTRNFPDRRYHHHRIMGTAERTLVGSMFSYGQKDYYLGGSPIWQVFRVAYRMTKRPICIGGVALLCGYCWAAIRRVKRPVSSELMRFHRAEQMRKLRRILISLARFHKVERSYEAGLKRQ